MKKWICWISVICLLLGGCFADEVPETASVPTVITTQVPETFPVEEDVVYFCNELEYYRLYSIRLDGTDLKLVSDERCYDVTQQEDTVYYLTDRGLAGYHIPTGQRQDWIDGVLEYEVSGSDLVYALRNEEYFCQDIYWQDIRTGAESLLLTLDMSMWAFADGVLYYTAYDYDTYGSTLNAYDLKTGATVVLSGSENYAYYYGLVADEGGVYCVFSDDSTQKWIYAPRDGSPIQDLSGILPYYGNIVSADENGFLFLDNGDPYETRSILCHFTRNGVRTDIAQAEEDGSFFVTPLDDSHWLVSHSAYEGWGEITEYGYYTHISNQRKNYLLEENLTLTPLDTTGPIGMLFREGDFPILDSSTARIPVTAELYDLFVMGYGYEGPQPLCSTTHGAWLNIADRTVDLAFLAAPTPEEQAYLESKNVEIEMKLYGGDGLVFIGNQQNPVTDLTHEQLIAIYQGQITNWKELGGPDKPISVFYRDDQSGSQRLFENLVFRGQELPDFEGLGFPVLDTMSNIVDAVLYDPYSIGYSIMTYLDEVYAEEELKVFSINGVYPSADTVKDQSYPYNTKGYLVIRKDEPEGSPARRLFDWFGCPVSDDLLKICGVSPLSE